MPRNTAESPRRTPRVDGLRLPARWVEHARTLMAWPCREELYGPLLARAREEWAEVARAVAGFEPVTMLARPEDAAAARDACGPGVEVVALPLDDSWVRDNGPVFLQDDGGQVAAVAFRFDGWDRQFSPFDRDAAVARRLAGRWDLRLYEAPFVLEGGAFNTDGEGTLLTTEQCLLHHRNRGMARRDYEDTLREWLGVDKVVWLPFGLVEDSGPGTTEGHVDDVAQFVAPGVVLAQTAPPGNPNHARLEENLAVLRAATDAAGRPLTVVEVEVLPYVSGEGAGLDVSGPGATRRMPAPYVNLVFVNGGVLLPRTGAEGEERAYALVAGLFPDREVVGLPVEMSAFGGGGLGCITQQVPAGPFLRP